MFMASPPTYVLLLSTIYSTLICSLYLSCGNYLHLTYFCKMTFFAIWDAQWRHLLTTSNTFFCWVHPALLSSFPWYIAFIGTPNTFPVQFTWNRYFSGLKNPYYYYHHHHYYAKNPKLKNTLFFTCPPFQGLCIVIGLWCIGVVSLVSLGHWVILVPIA